jgi:hypothetical protein
MKQSKKAKLPLAIQTVRSLTKSVLENVAGGTSYTFPSGPQSKCHGDTTLCGG